VFHSSVIPKFTEFRHYAENDSRVGDKLCLKLAEAMQMLPNHSPLLHTLLLKLHIPYDQQIFPHSGLSELVSAINLMCLPVLATHEISVDVKPNEIEDYDYYSDLDLPCTNFSAFLANHPNLAALTLSARGTELMEDVAFLPRLRSFKGSFKECAVICARQRQLEQLAITFVHPYYSFYNKLASFHTLPLSSHPALTKLHVLAVDAAGSVFVKPNELSPASFAQLVSSFPNLTHVDVCINKPMVSPQWIIG
jgi:hypothetical protein